MSWRQDAVDRLEAMCGLNPQAIGLGSGGIVGCDFWRNTALKTELTLNEHKLLVRLSRDGMLPYAEHEGPALDRLVELGLVRVFEVFVTNSDEVSFRWGGIEPKVDPLNVEPVRAINLTDKGRKEIAP